MGVVLWHKIAFPDLKVTLSSDVYSGDYLVDAAVTVTYGLDLPGTVEIGLSNLPIPLQEKLAGGLTGGKGKNGVKVRVHLGYLDDPSGGQGQVFEGRIESLEAATRFPPLGVALSGHEEAAFALLNTTALKGETPAPKQAHLDAEKESPDKLVPRILKAAKLAPAGKVTPDHPALDHNIDAENAFRVLTDIARKFDAEVLVQDGKVLFGLDVRFPPETGPIDIPPDPSAVLAFITGEDSLIALKSDKGLIGTQLAEFRPVQFGASKGRVTTDKPAAADVEAFDFTVVGHPALRAGQLVVASVVGYQNPFKPYRILQLTHSYTVDRGYVCTGRAVKFAKGESNRERSERARKGSALSIADRITGKIKDSQASSPVVDVGRVKAAKAADHVATLQYRTQATTAVTSPSVEADIPTKDAPTLLSKPIAAPFAWHRVGLSVPVYEGMRALLNQVRGSRDDTVVTGFLWSKEPTMDGPPAKDGDWWLCLPTAVSGNPPLPSGKGANDLTAADGRRVVEAVGLKIAVGKSACTDLGTRPSEGDADVLLITHKSGTTIKIDANGNVNVDAGSAGKVVLTGGGATLTVAKGKVAIS
jgi:hypothetical protein